MTRGNTNTALSRVWQLFNFPLLALTGLALLLRLFRLDFRSIWLDEAYSLKLASSDLQGIFSGAAMDIHPPLFHVLLAGWIRIFGSSEFAARSLSAVFGALLIPVVFKLTHVWVNRQAAWWSAALVTLSPYFLEISRSGRMAAQLILFSALSIYFFWKVLERGDRWNCAAYWVTTLAALYTHYFAFLLFLAQHFFIFIGIRKLNLPRTIRKTWMLLQMFLLVGYAPWLPYFWDHLSKGGPAWRGVGASWFEPIHSVYAFLVGTACWTWLHKGLVLAGLGAALAGIAGYCLPRFSTCYQLMRPRVWGLLLTLLLVPLGSVWIYSLYKINVFDNRYLSLSALVTLILLGTLLSFLPSRQRIINSMLVLLAFAIPIGNQYFKYGYYDNWRVVAAELQQGAQPGDIVAVYPAWNRTPLNYYLQDKFFIQGIPGNYDPITGTTENYFHIDPQSIHQLESIFSRYTSVWLVLVNEGELQTIVRDWFQLHYQIQLEKRFGGIHIIEFKKNHDE